ncbi:hypothetical protein OG455_11515 [Kitasatospora sp. NBC_01287]|uniref:hypothetical protein n=1 Tax=Kitasatospora sp. NBC_01287 TaxID=2903573 RepID=UPI00225B6ED9|nr:hypothetical protein [Kitasatospora sp. NBC_01287]MCX4746142.1 hypothetical protein [Kitasatospora sp. NBC_01287]
MSTKVTFYDIPAEHCIHPRTTNPVESTFSTIKFRTRVTCGAGSPAAAPDDRIHDSAEAIDLELTQILAYFGRSVEELDPVHTALVPLRGTGVQLLTSAAPRSRWQVIQGTNPPP